VARRRLTATSYVVLGLLTSGPATSYELKRMVADTVGHFWVFNHSQLYDEPARLVEAGLLTETREEHGRRRRTYTITEDGRAELAAWLAESRPYKTEVRDLGLLKLFFAALSKPADLERLARDQVRAHREWTAEYERLHAELAPIDDPWAQATLELGIRYERMAADFWNELLSRQPPPE
jgi:PadR family transcriptional regulator AphA